MIFGKGGFPLCQDFFPCAVGDKHADAAALVENPLVHQQPYALSGGSGVDGVELRQLVCAGNLLLLQKDLPEDVGFDHFANL